MPEKDDPRKHEVFLSWGEEGESFSHWLHLDETQYSAFLEYVGLYAFLTETVSSDERYTHYRRYSFAHRAFTLEITVHFVSDSFKWREGVTVKYKKKG